MWAFDWMIADPICSIFIAILIAISVWGLIKESVQILMQRQPQELDFQLPEACSKVCMCCEKTKNILVDSL